MSHRAGKSMHDESPVRKPAAQRVDEGRNGQMPATGPAARPQRALNRITEPGHAAYAPYFGTLT
jgi:hypothetical protein